MARMTVTAAETAAAFKDWSVLDLEKFATQGPCRPPQHWTPDARGAWADKWFPVDEVDHETTNDVRVNAEVEAVKLCEHCPDLVRQACLASLLRQSAVGLRYSGGIRGGLAPHQVQDFLRGNEVTRADLENVEVAA